MEAQIDSKIREQVNTYLPVVAIIDVAFAVADADNNRLAFSIFYAIPELDDKDLLEFTI